MGERLFQTDIIKSKVVPGQELNYEYDAGTHRISIQGAFLEFTMGSADCGLQYFSSHVNGGGIRMTAELVKILGKGVKIKSPIIEETTLAQLEGLDIVKNKVLALRESVCMANHGQMSRLKIVHIFERGGIKTEKIVVNPIPLDGDDSGLNIYAFYYGHT